MEHDETARSRARHALLRVRTERHRELRDITAGFRQAVGGAGIAEGACVICVPHTTAGLTINENADPAVCADILRWVEDVLSDERRFKHVEGNTGGQLISSLLGCSVTLPVARGDLALARWQVIYLVEVDGPCERTVRVTVY